MCLKITNEFKNKPLHSYFVNFDEIIQKIDSHLYRNPEEWVNDVMEHYALRLNKKDPKYPPEKIKEIVRFLSAEFHKKSMMISSLGDWVDYVRDNLYKAQEKLKKCPDKLLIHHLYPEFFQYTDNATFLTKESVEKATQTLKQIYIDNKNKLTQELYQNTSMNLNAKMVDMHNYKRIEPIGHGGYGEVYKEEDLIHHRVVAVKYINSNKDKLNLEISFSREIANQSQSVHPCILPFLGYSFYDQDSQPALIVITEYQKNGSLRKLLDESIKNKKKLLNNTQKTIIAFGIAAGMSSLHKNNILHRDLKSSNILLDDNFMPKISDFGLSKFIPESTNSIDMNFNTKMIGTYNWMAPEVMVETNYTQKADVYSYGLVLYEILTSLRPYSNMKNIQEVYNAAKKENMLKFPDLTEKNVIDLIHKCVKSNATRRPTFQDIVNSFLKGECWFSNTDPDKFYIAAKLFTESNDVPVDFDLAVKQNMCEVAKQKLSYNSEQTKDSNCLHVAIQQHSESMFNILLENKFTDVNLQDINGMTPLHIAVKENLPQFVIRLMENPNINPTILDNAGKAPIHYAAETGNCLSILLNYPNIDVNIKTQDRSTPILLATMMENKEAILALLMRPEIDINSISGPNNLTPLALATSKNFYDILLLFIASGKADMNTEAHIDLFFQVIKTGNVRAVSAILQSPNIDINVVHNGKTALECAFKSAAVEIVMLFLAQPHIQLNDDLVTHLINDAIKNKNHKLVYACIASSKINFNHMTERDAPPLITAVFTRDTQMLNALLKLKKIDVNIRSKSWPSYTALHFAVQQNYEEVVKLLLQTEGIQKDILSGNSKTPYQLAVELNYEKLINLLAPTKPHKK